MEQANPLRLGDGGRGRRLHGPAGDHARRPEIYLPPPLTAAFVIPFVFTVGVGWEIAEFTIDVALDRLGYGEITDVQYGLADMMSDLALNALGASIVAIWGTAYLVDVAATLSDRLAETEA